MRGKAGTICMVLGTVLVLAALSLFTWNRWEANKAEKAAKAVMPDLLDIISLSDDLPDPYDSEMKVVEIDGYGYVGYLSIPSLELQLPVMSEWDYDRLKLSPCRYSGSVKLDNMVIAGHNYAGHFANLKHLEEGAAVRFVDAEGRSWNYTVSMIETLQPEEVEKMTIPETEDDWDLTLFTCTPGGSTRCTVRCIRVEP